MSGTGAANRAPDADVVIGGGGMVGLSLALALAKGGLRVAVAEPMSPAAMTDDRFDGRVSAIAYAAIRMFRTLGLWQRIEHEAQPINDIVVSDAALGAPPSPFSLHFDHGEIGEALGAIVENRHLRLGLLAACAEEPAITLHSGVTLDGLVKEDGRVLASLSGGRQLAAALAIAADGRDSPLREAEGIGSVQWNYPQTGIVTTVAHEKPHRGVAYEHFLPAGPFAILPMTGNRSSLVWTERSEEARRIVALGDEDFARELSLRFGSHLGALQAEGPRWAYPLRLHLARAYVAERFALAGDAAHTIHPIAGQGLNLGLKDVAALTETLLDAARLGLDIGRVDVLKRYERWRRFDSFALAAATDGLNRLFSNNIRPLRLVRDLGLGAVDRIPALRRLFMRHAGGDLGRLPRLLRGEAA
jgi:2-octaprenyl-6-methoxyphenol hydroxylase